MCATISRELFLGHFWIRLSWKMDLESSMRKLSFPPTYDETIPFPTSLLCFSISLPSGGRFSVAFYRAFHLVCPLDVAFFCHFLLLSLLLRSWRFVEMSPLGCELVVQSRFHFSLLLPTTVRKVRSVSQKSWWLRQSWFLSGECGTNKTLSTGMRIRR